MSIDVDAVLTAVLSGALLCLVNGLINFGFEEVKRHLAERRERDKG